MRRRRLRGPTARLRAALLTAVAIVAVAAGLAAGPGGLLERAELATVDARFGLRGERLPDPAFVVVGIDAQTFAELGERWPFSRRVFAAALRNVARDRPRLIVYDVQFTEASGDSPAAIAADNALLLASRRAGNVVFSTTEVGEGGSTNVFGGERAQRFARAAVGNGLLPEDADGVLRRVQAEIDGLPSLAVTAARRLEARPPADPLPSGEAWIDFSGPDGHVPAVPFSRAARGSLPAGTFRDKVVIIGATAPILQDRHPVAWPGTSMSGPEIQANAIETLLRSAPLGPAPGPLATVLIVLLALAAPVAAFLLRPAAAIAAVTAVAAVYLAAAQAGFERGTILPVAAPLAGLAVGLVGAAGAGWLTSSVERSRAREAFARFVPDAVVTDVLRRTGGDGPRLDGVALEATVMFADLRGFTAWAEDAPPERVIDLLNRYLSLMSDAVLDAGGTIVSYMGDGVMAVFGAPVASADHADRALSAARAMLDRLAELNAWMGSEGFGDGFAMGIGLNTGRVMSGTVGSERRLEYAAVGDTTNVAARLEAATKGTPYAIVLSGATRERLAAVPDGLERVEAAALPGRRDPVAVWGMRADPSG